MRTQHVYGQPHATFVTDIPGGVRVTCPSCNSEIDLTEEDDQVHGSMEFCTECDRELLYPGWASW